MLRQVLCWTKLHGSLDSPDFSNLSVSLLWQRSITTTVRVQAELPCPLGHETTSLSDLSWNRNLTEQSVGNTALDSPLGHMRDKKGLGERTS